MQETLATLENLYRWVLRTFKKEFVLCSRGDLQSTKFAKDFKTNGIVESFSHIFESVSNLSSKFKGAVVYEMGRFTKS